eukprot:16435604-Heterocapsa_arctica.AAC.1
MKTWLVKHMYFLTFDVYTTTAWARKINVRTVVLSMKVCEGGSAEMQSMSKPRLFCYVRAKQRQCKSAVLCGW